MDVIGTSPSTLKTPPLYPPPEMGRRNDTDSPFPKLKNRRVWNTFDTPTKMVSALRSGVCKKKCGKGEGSVVPALVLPTLILPSGPPSPPGDGDYAEDKTNYGGGWEVSSIPGGRSRSPSCHSNCRSLASPTSLSPSYSSRSGSQAGMLDTSTVPLLPKAPPLTMASNRFFMDEMDGKEVRNWDYCYNDDDKDDYEVDDGDKNWAGIVTNSSTTARSSPYSPRAIFRSFTNLLFTSEPCNHPELNNDSCCTNLGKEYKSDKSLTSLFPPNISLPFNTLTCETKKSLLHAAKMSKCTMHRHEIGHSRTPLANVNIKYATLDRGLEKEDDSNYPKDHKRYSLVPLDRLAEGTYMRRLSSPSNLVQKLSRSHNDLTSFLWPAPNKSANTSKDPKVGACLKYEIRNNRIPLPTKQKLKLSDLYVKKVKKKGHHHHTQWSENVTRYKHRKGSTGHYSDEVFCMHCFFHYQQCFVGAGQIGKELKGANLIVCPEGNDEIEPKLRLLMKEDVEVAEQQRSKKDSLLSTDSSNITTLSSNMMESPSNIGSSLSSPEYSPQNPVSNFFPQHKMEAKVKDEGISVSPSIESSSISTTTTTTTSTTDDSYMNNHDVAMGNDVLLKPISKVRSGKKHSLNACASLLAVGALQISLLQRRTDNRSQSLDYRILTENQGALLSDIIKSSFNSAESICKSNQLGQPTLSQPDNVKNGKALTNKKSKSAQSLYPGEQINSSQASSIQDGVQLVGDRSPISSLNIASMPSWTSKADPCAHIWQEYTSMGDTCYLMENADCPKTGLRIRCSACKIAIHEACLPLLETIGFVCKSSFCTKPHNPTSSYQHHLSQRLPILITPPVKCALAVDMPSTGDDGQATRSSDKLEEPPLLEDTVSGDTLVGLNKEMMMGGGDRLSKHHWVHRRRRQEGKCKSCGKSFAPKFNFYNKEIMSIDCSWCKEAFHNKLSCFNATIYNQACDLGYLAPIIIPPEWIIKTEPKSITQNFLSTGPSNLTANFRLGHHLKASFRRSTRQKSTTKKKKTVAEEMKNVFSIEPTQLPTNVMNVAGSKPILILINPKSGGNKGSKLLHKFQWLLNPRQVFDITTIDPKYILELYKNVPNLRVLVCGGDGTVGWIFSTMDVTAATHHIPLAILPLGTGNDLARFLGWGGSYNDDSLTKVLMAVSDGPIAQLDRWNISVQPNVAIEKNVKFSLDEIEMYENIKSGSNNNPRLEVVKCGEAQPGSQLCQSLDVASRDTSCSSPVKSELPLDVINNYFGLGSDAQVTLEFHLSREANPEKFNSRLRNKMFYAGVGGKDILKRSWKDLVDHMTLQCDGVDLTEKIQDMKFHCILFLNISRYAGGTLPWGTSPESSGFDEPRSDDGLLEVVGFTASSLAALQVGGHGYRICQCKHVRLVTFKTIPCQVDGEPCKLSPSIIHITFRNKAIVVQKRKRSLDPTTNNIQTSISPEMFAPIRENRIKIHSIKHSDLVEKGYNSIYKSDYLGSVSAQIMEMDLSDIRKYIEDKYELNHMFQNDVESQFKKLTSKKWIFLGANNGTLKKIGKREETFKQVSDVCLNQRVLYIMTYDDHDFDDNNYDDGDGGQDAHKNTQTTSDPDFQSCSQDVSNLKQRVWLEQSPKNTPFTYEAKHSLDKYEKAFIDASKRGDLVKMISLVSDNNVNMCVSDDTGMTSLHYGACFGHNDIVKYLVENGPKSLIDVKDFLRGQTALHKAAWYRRHGICAMLVENGASIDIKDYKGRNSYDQAIRAEDLELAEYLKDRLPRDTKNIEIIETLV